ncbi:MAG: septal ring lytic transglycosylase RlpA family protein [Myxococcales bacterium]|jgi:rare lipoprotein A|nr:septal ring lytic transglycosylase RlpA family protein [Myxococcales bacterium]
MKLTTLALVACALAACAPKPAYHAPEPAPGALRSNADSTSSPRKPQAPPDAAPLEVGLASWYGMQLAGRKTASGEPFDPRLYTAAHRTLKIGTWVDVRRVDTQTSVRVRINDRGPTDPKRVIDLSQRAAEDLGMIKEGLTKVELRIVSGP